MELVSKRLTEPQSGWRDAKTPLSEEESRARALRKFRSGAASTRGVLSRMPQERRQISIVCVPPVVYDLTRASLYCDNFQSKTYSIEHHLPLRALRGYGHASRRRATPCTLPAPMCMNVCMVSDRKMECWSSSQLTLAGRVMAIVKRARHPRARWTIRALRV